MTMDELKPKQSAFICSVGGDGNLRHHLLDMGLTPQTEVMLQKIAPMGDPIQIEIRIPYIPESVNLAERKVIIPMT